MGDHTSDGWYTNRELLEMVRTLQLEMQTLTQEMKDTRSLLNKYNGLQETISTMERRVYNIEVCQSSKIFLADRVIKWGGWILGIASLTYAVFGGG